MNRRTKTLWLPGMVTLLGASLSLMIFQQSGTHPSYWTWKGAIVLMFYWPWLALLPLCGAAGAYLGKHAHAQLGTRVAVATSPALLLLIVMCGILPLEMIADGFSWFRVVYFAVAIVNWVVIPAAALLFGAAPFLRHSRGEAETLFSTSEV